MQLRRDASIGLMLAGFGAVTGIAVVSFFVMHGETIPMSMLVAPGGLVFLGVIMVFSEGLNRLSQSRMKMNTSLI